MEATARMSPVLQVNCPEWFADPVFLAWLNRKNTPLMTWHQIGDIPDEWSDTVVWVDPGLSGEGSEQDTMPSKFWDQIVTLCRDNFEPSRGFHIVVRLMNVS